MFDRVGRLCQYVDIRSPDADQATIVVHVECPKSHSITRKITQVPMSRFQKRLIFFL